MIAWFWGEIGVDFPQGQHSFNFAHFADLLLIIASALLILLYRAQTAAMHLEPLIISVTDHGSWPWLGETWRTISVIDIKEYA